MSHPDLITTSIWDEPGNIEKLKAMWADGYSASEIARAIGDGATRSAVLGKAHRMKLPGREERRPRTVNGDAPRRGNMGNPGQAKAANIIHRIEGREKAERARQEGKHSHAGHEPFRAPGRVDVDDDGGVDVSHLIAFADRKIGRECAWIPGDPLNDAMCCGKPVKEGSQ